ncbi:MAG TPA: TonB-dependent receptor [Terriglobales bacterium]|nr:TonB-dependent receptor [Terriglobales bacterium]
MTGIVKVLFALGMFLVWSAAALAQSAATAELHVSVKDPKGAVVRDATVVIRNEARNFERVVTRNIDGEYIFPLLPPGRYVVTVEAPGFAKVQTGGVAVTVGQRALLPVALQVASVTEVVDVSSEPSLVETQITASTSTIDQVRIDNLPINGRNYINFALTNSQITRDTAPSIGAAPTSGLNFAGQRARSNLVNVDGLDAVDNSTNGIRSTVSQEAVQEFQIMTNSYAPEYGRASGGVVNIITRSGTNAWHGTLFGYLRNRKFQAVNAFSTVEDPAYTRVQAGATVGGPIVKDRTFYFFSYETTRRQETGFSTIGQNNFDLVPFPTPLGNALLTQDQVNFIQQNATNPAVAPLIPTYLRLAGAASSVALTGNLPGVGRAFVPLAAGQAPVPLPQSYVPLLSIVGNYPVKEVTNVYSLRLDQRITNAQQLNLRVGVSPSYATGIQVNAQGPQNFGQNSWSATSTQDFHDFGVYAQHTWTLGANKVNEFRFQGSRRGLLYNFSDAPGGSNVRVQIAGYAFVGREPFSFVRRTEKRFQFADNLSITKGRHNIKFGVDVNYLPLEADFTVNFGGLYNFSSINLPAPFTGFPALSPVQAYGVGIPNNFVQGIGNPHDEFSQKAIGAFWQDSWRVTPRLTLNYGVRYDVELTPTFRPVNAISDAAERALGIVQGIPRDYNNFAPRVGLAYDPWGDGKTVIRAAYGLFYDHPLLGLAFDSDVADGSQAPQLILFGGSPSSGCSLNATNVFQGTLACPPNFGYLPNEQRFDSFLPNSIFVNQNYLQAGVPLVLQPFGFPVARDFVYAYANQANLTFQRDLGHNYALSLEYNFNGGRHLNRPINANNVRPDLLVQNWQAAVAAGDPGALGGDPRLVGSTGVPCGVGPAGPWVSSALVSFFRPSGVNPSFVPLLQQAPGGAQCLQLANSILAAGGLGIGANGGPCNPLDPSSPFGNCVPIPFSDMPANYSNGSSVYHGLSVNLRKRFATNYEFLASYTWSHAIDDSTDLESPLQPANNLRPDLERSNSTFDQRHRFIFSSVITTGRLSGNGFVSKLFSDWTFAPVIEIGSGRPFNIIVGGDRNFDFSTGTDRPLAVGPDTPRNACGDVAVASRYSPTGFLQPPCFRNGTFQGTIGRNAGTRPYNLFTDLRVSRTIRITERVGLEAIADAFNIINRFNVADVNPIWTDAGRPTAAFDPRQFQFALKLTW